MKNSNNRRIYYGFFIALGLTALVVTILVATRLKGNVPLECANGIYTRDLFPHKVTNDESNGIWSVDYFGTYKKLSVAGLGYDYYLYQRGTIPPCTLPWDVLVEIPIRRAAIDSSTNIPLFELIGERASIVGFQSGYGLPVFVAPCMQKLVEEERIKTFQFGDLDIPQFEVFFGSSTADYSDTNLAGSSVLQIQEDSNSNPTVFGLAEWTEVVSLFFNKEEVANNVTANIRDRYDCAKNLAAQQPVKKKVIAFFFNFYQLDPSNTSDKCEDANEKLTLSVVGCNADFRNPLCDIFEDAGGDYVNVPDDLSTRSGAVGTYHISAKSFRSFIEDNGSNIDVLYYLDDISKSMQYVDQECESYTYDYLLPIAKEKPFYDNFGTVAVGEYYNSTDWFETRYAEPDLVLLDIVATLFPLMEEIDHEIHFFRNISMANNKFSIPNSRILSADLCVDVNEPLFEDWKSTTCSTSSPNV